MKIKVENAVLMRLYKLLKMIKIKEENDWKNKK